MLTYLRAIRANKVLLAGYALVGGALLTQVPGAEEFSELGRLSGIAGLVSLVASNLGIFTYLTMRDAEDLAERTGTLPESFQKHEAKTYCSAAAVADVARRFGLEDQLTAETSVRATLLSYAKRYVGIRDCEAS